MSHHFKKNPTIPQSANHEPINNLKLSERIELQKKNDDYL